MLSALARRRSLAVLIVLAVAITAFGAPAVTGDQGHCPGASDQHCQPALLQAASLPGPRPFGLIAAPEPSISPPTVIALLLKIPLIA